MILFCKMKTLIIIAGLPGVGKSFACRILKKKLKTCLYFDSDLFAKKYAEKRRIDLVKLPPKEQNKARLKFHKSKIDNIKKSFEKYDIVFLDTCFDMAQSRRLFYEFAKNSGIDLVIIEVVCSEETVKKRILEHRHEEERMVGDKETRWKIYHQMKSQWKAIKKKHFILDSEKDVQGQLNKFLKSHKTLKKMTK